MNNDFYIYSFSGCFFQSDLQMSNTKVQVAMMQNDE